MANQSYVELRETKGFIINFNFAYKLTNNDTCLDLIISRHTWQALLWESSDKEEPKNKTKCNSHEILIIISRFERNHIQLTISKFYNIFMIVGCLILYAHVIHIQYGILIDRSFEIKISCALFPFPILDISVRIFSLDLFVDWVDENL